MAERKKFWTWRRLSLSGGLTAILLSGFMLATSHDPKHHPDELALNAADLASSATSPCDSDCDLSQAGVAAYHQTVVVSAPTPAPVRFASTLPAGMKPLSADEGAAAIARLNPASFTAPGVAGVPEPNTWVLLFLGVAAVGASMRARPAHGNEGQLVRAPARIRRR